MFFVRSIVTMFSVKCPNALCGRSQAEEPVFQRVYTLTCRSYLCGGWRATDAECHQRRQDPQSCAVRIRSVWPRRTWRGFRKECSLPVPASLRSERRQLSGLTTAFRGPYSDIGQQSEWLLLLDCPTAPCSGGPGR